MPIMPLAMVAFSVGFYIVVIGFWIWIAWKFYQALARIGEELAEIRKSVQAHFPPPPLPSGPPPPEPARGMIT